MKKLTLTLFAMLVLALTLAGCGDLEWKQGETDTNRIRLNNYDDAILQAEYHGHSYIIYKGSQKGGITHDPDCPCHNTIQQ